jgi:hypothetical protein
MTLPTDLKPSRIDWRLPWGYALISLGAPALFMGFWLPLMMFTRRYGGPPLAQFSLHHPVTIVALCAAAVGAVLVFAGGALLAQRSTAPCKHDVSDV